MKLSVWLKQNQRSYLAFGMQIGSSAPQVCRFVNGTRMPSLETCAEIQRATGGQVTALDFLPADLPPPVALAA